MEGSKVLTLEITMTDLSAQMKEHSYYLGEALKSDPNLIEIAAKLQASDDDDSVLMDFIKEGSTKMGNVLSRVVGKTTYAWDEDKTKVTFTTNAVANFMDAQKGTLQDSMVCYISAYVLYKWLNLMKPDECPRFATILSDLEEDMRQLGAQRDKPVRG